MSIRRSSARFVAFAVGFFLLVGCSDKPIKHRDGHDSSRAFTARNLAKTDVDMVTELTQREVLAGLRRLTVKFYLRNPMEFRKAGFDNSASAVGRIFDPLAKWSESGMDRVNWAESLRLAFAERYTGDRVHAFMLALTVMTMASYEHRTEFFIADSLDAQSLYNSARNLETAAWKLAHARTASGTPFLLGNSLDEEVPNLSFEREFGKLIAQQDMLALIAEDKTNRTISRIIQNVASFILLPV